MRFLAVFIVIVLSNCFSYCNSSDDDFDQQKEKMKAYPIDQNWVEINIESSPAPRYDHGMVFFAQLNGIVLFGGRNSDTGESFNDTWLLKNDKWSVLNPKTSPSPRFRFGMAYDNLRGKIVIYGGTYSNYETWEFDGNDWSKINTAHHPGSLAGHGMTFFPKLRKTILFGGLGGNSYYNETWVYNGVDWEKLNLAGNLPGERMSTDMIYDPDKESIFMFGGQFGPDFYNDSWRFDGVHWTQISTQHSPSARILHKMAYNTFSSRIVLYGGTRNTFLNDTWEFYNEDWTEVETVNKPSERAAMALAYYPSSVPYIALFGGGNIFVNPPCTLNDTWNYIFLTQGIAPSISIEAMLFLLAFLSVLIFYTTFNKRTFLGKFFHNPR